MVAEAALRAGASIVNDISASLEGVAAEHGAGWIAMHMQGDPATMQVEPRYDDVVAEVRDYLVGAAQRGRAAGVSELWIDPGFGFGKTQAHNWLLLAGIDHFVATGVPVVVGTSRKGFLGAAVAASDRVDTPVPPTDRLEATTATTVWAATMGAAMVRVHDVRAAVEAVTVAGPARPDAVMAGAS